MKKLISLLITFTMVVALFASLNVTAVSAASETLYNFQYYNSSNKYLYTGYNESTNKYSGKYFQNGSNVTESVAHYDSMTNVSDEPFVNVISEKYIWNNAVGTAGAVDFTKPVMNFNFKMYIPEADLNSARTLNFMLAKKDASNARPYNNSNYGTVYFTLTNDSGKIYGGASTNAENISRVGGKLVEGDKWHDMSIRVFTNVEGQLMFGMYMDKKLYVWCKSTASNISFDDIGVRQVYFTTTKNTYIKDMKLDFEDVDPAYLPNSIDLKYADNNAFAWAKVANGAPRLIIAAYDTNEKMIGIKVSTSDDISNGTVQLDFDTSSISGIAKLKAFKFGNLSSCIPLVGATTLEVN
ncbi:MAG: hypothetical protein UH854_04475 [Clostridia bacterium]|nr:hypothetical protein [Clostridia bacterium]